MTRRLAALGVLPAVAALGVATTAPAGAATTTRTVHRVSRQAILRDIARVRAATSGTPYGTCQLVVPATIRLSQYVGVDSFSVAGGCGLNADEISAAWYAGGDTYSDSPLTVLFDHESGEFSEEPDVVGVLRWKGWFAFDDQGHTYTQNSPQTTVKVASWAGLWTSRAGNKVTINTRAVRYGTLPLANIPWAGATGLIQYRDKGTSIWHNLKDVTTNSAGTFAYRYIASATRDYRAVYAEQPYIWGATSPTSRR